MIRGVKLWNARPRFASKWSLGTTWASVCIAVYVSLAALAEPLRGYDAAYNLQVVLSLRRSLVYTPLYHPMIYNPEITTNGPIQYLVAITTSLFGDRIGLAVGLGSIAFGVFLVAARFSRFAFAGLCLLFISYQPVESLSVQFLGEFFALGLLIAGLSRLLRESRATSEKMFQLSRSGLLSGILFGFASSTKLMVAPFVPLLAFGLIATIGQCGTQPLVRKLVCGVIRASLVTLVAAATLVSTFFFSQAHSRIFLTGTSRDIEYSSFSEFIQSHLAQGQGATSLSPFDYLTAPRLLVPLIVVSLAVLLLAGLAWVPYSAALILALQRPAMTERRAFLLIVPLVLLALAILEHMRETRDSESTRFRLVPLILRPALQQTRFHLFQRILPAVVIFLFFGIGGVAVNEARGPLWNLKHHVNSLSEEIRGGSFDNQFRAPNSSPLAVAVIQRSQFPIVTSGWWQFPELQLETKKSFIDRMSVQSGLSPSQASRVLLLFDPTNHSWPETTKEMCQSIVLEEPSLILCRYRSDLPLDHRWVQVP